MINNALIPQQGASNTPAPPTIGTASNTNQYGGGSAYGSLITIAWGAGTFPGGFSSYKVYLNGSLLTTITNSATLSYDDTNVYTPGDTNSYYVRAYDSFGQYAQSNTVAVVVCPNNIPTITSFTATQGASGVTVNINATTPNGIYFITFYWSAPNNTNVFTGGNGTYNYYSFTFPTSASYSQLIPFGSNIYANVAHGNTYYFMAWVRDYYINDNFNQTFTSLYVS